MSRRFLAVLALSALAACSPVAGPPAVPSSAPQRVAQAPSGCHVVDGRADRRCTPGVRNPQVTQANIATTICKSGWAATVRPPVSYTEPLKRKQMAAYSEPAPSSLYEEDHLIPLEAGGSPTDPANLWPEPRSGPHPAAEKDAAENAIRRAICNGRLTLAAAQSQILTAWTH